MKIQTLLYDLNKIKDPIQQEELLKDFVLNNNNEQYPLKLVFPLGDKPLFQKIEYGIHTKITTTFTDKPQKLYGYFPQETEAIQEFTTTQIIAYLTRGKPVEYTSTEANAPFQMCRWTAVDPNKEYLMNHVYNRFTEKINKLLKQRELFRT